MKHPALVRLILGFASLFVVSAACAAEIPGHASKSINLSEPANLAKLFHNKLVDANGKRVKSEDLAKARYVAVYFSAHWCPACRAFTPKLVKFFNDNKKDSNFEVVFVSSDSSEKEMRAYMRETKMPWGGLLKGGPSLKSITSGTKGIPHLRVFDATGKVVVDSVEDGQYVRPSVVLEQLAKLIK